MKKSLLAVGLCTLAVASAQAAPVFYDNFDTSSSVLNWDGGSKWTVTNGTVDLIADGDYSLNCAGASGGCVDLDGSGDSGIVTSTQFQLVGGTQYSISALLSGSPAGYTDEHKTPNNVRVTLNKVFGTKADLVVREFGPYASGPLNYTDASFLFTPSATSLYTLSFENYRMDGVVGDNVGAMLDSVAVTAVPLPAAAWLLLSGLGGVAAFTRRRKMTAAA